MSQVELLHSELIDMIKDPEYYSEEETVTHLNLLIKEIVNYPKHGKAIVDSYIQEKIEKGICPECNEPLDNIPHKEPSEYQGRNVYEITYTKQCPNCGWNEDKN